MDGSQWTCFGVRVPRKTGLSYHKLKYMLTYTVSSQFKPVPDKQTDGQKNIMAIARPFVVANASSAKNHYNQLIFTVRAYARAVLGVVILSVCQTRAL